MPQKKKKILPTTAKLALACTLATLTSSTWAAQPSEAKVNALLQKVSQRTNALEQQVQSLNSEIAELKAEQVELKQTEEKHHQASIERYLHGTPVTTSPYLGTHSAYDGSNLIVNMPLVGQDVQILKQRQHLDESLAKEKLTMPKHPIIQLSGQLEAVLQGRHNYTGPTESDATLTTAEIDIAALFNAWSTGFMALTYDDSKTSPTRVANSRLFLDRGFMTIGDLYQSPFYFTIGQYYMPFGNYNTYLVTDPLTKTLGRIRSRGITLGYQHQGATGVFANLFAFKGDTRAGSSSEINRFGGTLGDDFAIKELTGTIGASVVNDLAESTGMQSTGAPGANFGGFGTTEDSERLNHEVPGVDAYTNLSLGPVAFLGEYTGATKDFSASNLSFDNHGAKPQAMHAELDYTFDTKKPTNLSVAYDHTWQALGINLPEQRYSATLNVSWWRDTVESLEVRHDINYGTGNTATGNATSRGGLPVTADLAALGRAATIVTAQLAFYF